MSYRPRVKILCREGSYDRILRSRDFAGQRLKGDNVNSVKLLTVAWTALLADSPVDPVKPAGLVNRFVSSLTTDFRAVTGSYSRLADLLSRISSGGERDGDIIVALYDGFKKTPVFREFHEFIRTDDASIYAFLFSFLLFGKKLYIEDSSLDAISLRDWLEVEDRLRSLALPRFVDNLREVVYKLFEDFEIGPFLPVHGGGSVSERRVKGTNLKNAEIRLTKGMKYVFRDSIFVSDDINAWIPDPTSEISENGPFHSRLKFVPKDYRKTRSICMEPIGHQFTQQGVRLWIESYLKQCPLRDFIFIEDQSRNQQASRRASTKHDVDTIDLSAASDSVSWDLIKRVFPPQVLKYLAATRTSSVELPDGKFFDLSKFAPMGSALCFPTQSILYASLIIMIGISERYGLDWLNDKVDLSDDVDFADLIRDVFSLKGRSRHSYRPFLVYGDDIICDKRMTSSLLNALDLLGFQTNREKSYTGEVDFRESCGGFYFKGHDVTPIRFSIKKISQEVGITQLAGVVSLANEAYRRGFTNLRRHLIQFALYYPIKGVRSTGRNPILFSSDDDASLAVYHPDPTNLHLDKRVFDPSVEGGEETHQRYQRDEVLSIGIAPTKYTKLSKKFDNYRYYRWWRSSRSSVESTPLASGSLLEGQGAKPCSRWTAA
jgi:hypothetical protein